MRSRANARAIPAASCSNVTGMDASPGDEVVIIGEQEDERIDVREMAAALGTIPWEVVCRVGTRIERVYEGR